MLQKDVDWNLRNCYNSAAMSNLANFLLTVSLAFFLLSTCCTAFRPNAFRMPQSVASNLASSSKSLHKRVGSAHTEETKLFASKAEPVAGFGDDGCALPSPSKVNTLPKPLQAAVFFGYYLALYGGTTALVSGIEALKSAFPGAMGNWMATWPILGPMFMAAGLSHFSMKAGFENIMPAQGAWGFWYLPGSKSFHVAWTGVVEFLAGLWLTIGAGSKLIFGISLPDAFQLGSGSIIGDASLVLFTLTLLVTPANIYMLTHGAALPPTAVEPVPLAGHALRAVLQCLLLAIFYEMAIPSIYHLQTLIV